MTWRNRDRRKQVRPVWAIAQTGRAALLWDGGCGLRVYGAAALALGAIGMVCGNFTMGFHPVTDTMPSRTPLAYGCALLFIFGAVGLQHERSRTAAAGVTGLLYLTFMLCWGRRVLALPLVIGTWLGAAEQLLLAIGALSVAVRARPAPQTPERVCRVTFGACEIVFGLAHFLNLSETTAMTPAWAPLGPGFWSLATGAAHLAAGLALICAFHPAPTPVS